MRYSCYTGAGEINSPHATLQTGVRKIILLGDDDLKPQQPLRYHTLTRQLTARYLRYSSRMTWNEH